MVLPHCVRRTRQVPDIFCIRAGQQKSVFGRGVMGCAAKTAKYFGCLGSQASKRKHFDYKGLRHVRELTAKLPTESRARIPDASHIDANAMSVNDLRITRKSRLPKATGAEGCFAEYDVLWERTLRFSAHFSRISCNSDKG